MRYLLLFFCLITTFTGYSQKKNAKAELEIPYKRSGNVTFDTYNKGVITLITQQSGSSFEKAMYHGELNALENLLFKGIPGSPQENAIVKDETANGFLEKFIYEGGYEKFLTNTEVLETFKNKSVFTVKQKLSFDLENMRRELEKNNVIRKFGL